jgi:hypothetical protein
MKEGGSFENVGVNGKNIKTDLKIGGWEAVVWVHVVQNMDQWPAFVSTVISRPDYGLNSRRNRV